MPGYIADYFAAAGRMTDMHGTPEVQVRGQRRQVIGIVIHIVTVGGLARASMAASVMGDDPKAVIQEEKELRVPIIGGERPAVRKHDGSPAAPVFVKYRNPVFGRDGAHRLISGVV